MYAQTHMIMFPGQGSQRVGMGRNLFDEHPKLTRLASDVVGFDIKKLCLEGPCDILGRGEFIQPAVFLVNALAFLTWRSRHTDVAVQLAGHSLGEYNALWAAGALDFTEASAGGRPARPSHGQGSWLYDSHFGDGYRARNRNFKSTGA